MFNIFKSKEKSIKKDILEHIKSSDITKVEEDYNFKVYHYRLTNNIFGVSTRYSQLFFTTYFLYIFNNETSNNMFNTCIGFNLFGLARKAYYIIENKYIDQSWKRKL